MKTNEKLECVIQELGMTPQDVVQNFVSQKKLDSKFLEEMAKKAKGFENVTIISSKKFVTPKDIQAGMFEYQSGLIYPELIPEEKLRGIVGYADGKEILIWCLSSKQLCWSKDFWEVGTKDLELRGWETTRIILETAKKLWKSAPAAQWCFDYAEDGVEKGSAFLLSYADFKRMMPNMYVVRCVFNEIGIKFDDLLWSSSEASNGYSWILCTGNGASQGGLDYNGKNTTYYVRPMRRIER